MCRPSSSDQSHHKYRHHKTIHHSTFQACSAVSHHEKCTVWCGCRVVCPDFGGRKLALVGGHAPYGFDRPRTIPPPNNNIFGTLFTHTCASVSDCELTVLLYCLFGNSAAQMCPTYSVRPTSVKSRRCSTTEKVTVGLALHWLYEKKLKWYIGTYGPNERR